MVSSVDVIRTEIAERRQRLEELRAAAAHEQEAISALEHALAVLGEQMPRFDQAPAQTPPTPAVAASVKPKRRSSRGGAHFARDPLQVHPKARGAREQGLARSPQKTLAERAAAIDLAKESPTFLERTDLVVQMIAETEGHTTTTVALRDVVEDLLECSTVTASTIVSRCLPIALKQGRIKILSGSPGSIYTIQTIQPQVTADSLSNERT